MNAVILVVVGMACGTMAGLIGIAGGIFLIPAMIYLLGFSPKMATGTMLAVMLPPIGLGAAYVYWRSGNVNIKAAMLIALGFFVGGIIGANSSSHFSSATLTKALGAITAIVSVKMLFFS